ncbi:hypothetical protein [Roseicyclus sp.]
MKFLEEGYREISTFVELNMDRFLVPILIVAALTLGGWAVTLLQ